MLQTFLVSINRQIDSTGWIWKSSSSSYQMREETTSLDNDSYKVIRSSFKNLIYIIFKFISRRERERVVWNVELILFLDHQFDLTFEPLFHYLIQFVMNINSFHSTILHTFSFDWSNHRFRVIEWEEKRREKRLYILQNDDK